MELVGAYSNLALQSQNFGDLQEQIFGTTVKIKVVAKTKPVRQTQRRLSQIEREALGRDYENGLPTREIVAKYNINRDTVNEHVRRMGLPKRHPTTG